jgi:hypothetical protein
MNVDALRPIGNVWCIMQRNASFVSVLVCINEVARLRQSLIEVEESEASVSHEMLCSC